MQNSAANGANPWKHAYDDFSVPECVIGGHLLASRTVSDYQVGSNAARMNRSTSDPWQTPPTNVQDHNQLIHDGQQQLTIFQIPTLLIAMRIPIQFLNL
jgi:hypothetical protein